MSTRAHGGGTPFRIQVVSPPGVVEVLPGYNGPRTAAELNRPLAPRVWAPVVHGHPAVVPGPTQIDARSYTVDQVWSGLRFLFKVDALNVAFGFSTQNLFTTHIGRTFKGKAHWTEIGVIRFADDPVYHLYTYTHTELGEDGWNFFGTMQPGEVFEFAIRLNEADPGPYHYETFCSGRRVRRGKMPVLDNQVDVSHETWTESGFISGGDHVIAVEGWVDYPPAKARWYAPDLPIGFYSTDPRHKIVGLDRPTAYKFASATPGDAVL